MIRVRFLRDFDWPTLITRKCLLCKVWGVIVYRASRDPIPVPPDVAAAAVSAGSAVVVPEEGDRP